jgi:hypothetical protein
MYHLPRAFAPARRALSSACATTALPAKLFYGLADQFCTVPYMVRERVGQDTQLDYSSWTPRVIVPETRLPIWERIWERNQYLIALYLLNRSLYAC